jgi:hypothetical protein
MDNPFTAPPSVMASPKPSKPSRLISVEEWANMYAAAEFAAEHGLWFDTTVTITWGLLGADTDEKAQKMLTAFVNCLRNWLEKRKQHPVWIYSHEVGKTHGLHTHFAMYLQGAIPGCEGETLRKDFRQWVRKWIKRQVGGNAPNAIRVRGPNKETPRLHWVTFSYLCKGYDPTAMVQSGRNSHDGDPVLLRDLNAAVWRDPGPVALKLRVNCSGTLQAEQRAKGYPYESNWVHAVEQTDGTWITVPVPRPRPPFRSKFEDGFRDARILYPADFYERVTKLPAVNGPKTPAEYRAWWKETLRTMDLGKGPLFPTPLEEWEMEHLGYFDQTPYG